VKVNPDPKAFCGVLFCFNTFCRYPPKTGEYLFGEFNECGDLYDVVSNVLKEVGRMKGIPCDLISPHGIRAGIVEHLATLALCDRLIAGDWADSSIGAIKAYMRVLISWADRTAAATHSMTTTPFEFLGWLHGTGADDAGQSIRPAKLN